MVLVQFRVVINFFQTMCFFSGSCRADCHQRTLRSTIRPSLGCEQRSQSILRGTRRGPPIYGRMRPRQLAEAYEVTNGHWQDPSVAVDGIVPLAPRLPFQVILVPSHAFVCSFLCFTG